MSVLIRSRRLRLNRFEMADAEDVFSCITPKITRFMRWEAPSSLAEFKAERQVRLQSESRTVLSLVVRRDDTLECLGMAAIEEIASGSPEIGLWLKQSAHGRGYGREVVGAVVAWASRTLEAPHFLYPVAAENVASRRIAESLGGEVIDRRTTPQYEALVYAIAAIRE